MPDSLSGIRLKVSRAAQELDKLKADVIAFLDTHPYMPRVHFDKQTRYLTFSVHVLSVPDPMWGVRIGEVVHNLRSALDHIVWQLVVMNTGKPPTVTKTQFPIFQHEAGFRDRGLKLLQGVSKDATDMIEAEQPFRTGEGIKSPRHLHELSNIDKHRTLHVTGAMVHQFAAEFPPLKQRVTINDVTLSERGEIQQDTVLWRGCLDGASEWPFTQRDVKSTLGVDVAFEKGVPIDDGTAWLAIGTLRQVAGRTERVLGRLATEVFKIKL